MLNNLPSMLLFWTCQSFTIQYNQAVMSVHVNHKVLHIMGFKTTTLYRESYGAKICLYSTFYSSKYKVFNSQQFIIYRKTMIQEVLKATMREVYFNNSRKDFAIGSNAGRKKKWIGNKSSKPGKWDGQEIPSQETWLQKQTRQELKSVHCLSCMHTMQVGEMWEMNINILCITVDKVLGILRFKAFYTQFICCSCKYHVLGITNCEITTLWGNSHNMFPPLKLSFREAFQFIQTAYKTWMNTQFSSLLSFFF